MGDPVGGPLLDSPSFSLDHATTRLMTRPKTARTGRTLALLALPAMNACAEAWPAPPPVEEPTFLSEHEEWRASREARAVSPPGGAVLWIGLWDLPAGPTRFGSDADLPIVLPAEDAPPFAGTLIRSGRRVRLHPAPGSGLALYEGAGVDEPIELVNDREENPTRLTLGSLGLRVHAEPGTDRLWLRAWDEDMPARDTFTLPDYFPVDTAWRVSARFEAYEEPVVLTVPDVAGGTIEYTAPGDLVFRVGRREHRLIATAGPRSTSYHLMMWDSTAVTTTYQGGRYLRVPLADEDGWTTIDFNRAYNAPCVFTAYSVCGLPPRENWLALAVTAGEMRPDPAARP